MKILVKGILITSLLCAFLSSSLYAIDEDYFIPYTDNYGYEYDPETGTYIKNDNPAPAQAETPQTTVDSVNNTNADTQPASVAPELTTVNENTPFRLPLILAAIVIVLGLTIVFIKAQKKES